MDKIDIFDTTLRDGEQSPGAAMNVEQKYEIALQLEKLGVDVIEAGFPVSSPQQFEGCRLIAERVRGVTVAALSRAVKKDIDSAADSIKAAAHPRIHTFLSTSPIHMDHKLNKKPDEVFQMAVEAVKYARNLSAEVEFSPEDATRSEMDFLCRVIEGVIAAGATIVNIPDTVGYTVPTEFHAMITEIRQRVPNIDKAKISVHCHNDLGLGVANTIAAIQAGARQAEVTINGIGERAGNASLEELVMALNVRQDVLPYSTDINTSHIYNSSRMLATIIGFPIPRNKAIVGDNAFAHEAGIHQDGVLKYRQTYEIMTPKTVGRDDSKIILGRHSGLHGYTKRLEDLSITLTDDELKHTYERFLQIADRKKEIFDEDIFAIVGDELGRHLTTMKLEYFNIISGNTTVPTATVRISDGDTVHEETATGDGSVDAIFRAIEGAVGIETTLEEYHVQAVTPGKQALGEVSVIVRIAGQRFSGTGSSTDVLEASARAYVSAVARFAALREATDE